MGEFNGRPPLFIKLSAEHDKIPESGAELADKVDKMVVEIKNTKDKKEKQKMLEKLLVHIHPILGKAVFNFYRRFFSLLSRRGFTEEDVYDKAVEEMIKYVEKWEDQETRKSKGKTPAHFTSYFLDTNALNNGLNNEFIRPALSEKRTGEEMSMSQPAPGFKEGQGRDLEDVLPDKETENALASVIRKQEIEMGRDVVLEKLYNDKYPFSSLMAILKFGLGKDVLDEWKKKFDLSVTSGKIRKDYRKYIPRVEEIMEKYNGGEMMYQEIGDLLGVSKDNVKLRLEVAFKNLKEKS